MPKQEKKKTFTVSESKCESHQGNLMEKTKQNKTKKHFLEVSTTISVQYPVKIRLLFNSEKEFWKIKGINLGSIVGPLNVGYRFSTPV